MRIQRIRPVMIILASQTVAVIVGITGSLRCRVEQSGQTIRIIVGVGCHPAVRVGHCRPITYVVVGVADGLIHCPNSYAGVGQPICRVKALAHADIGVAHTGFVPYIVITVAHVIRTRVINGNQLISIIVGIARGISVGIGPAY